MSALAHEISRRHPDPRNPMAFHIGAAADVLVGMGLTVFAGDVASLLLPQHAEILGIAAASVMRFLGLFLILFAIETVVVARSQGALGRFRSWIVGANWATVALAIVVIAAWHAALSMLGIAAVAAIAVAVGLFAFLQGRSL